MLAWSEPFSPEKAVVHHGVRRDELILYLILRLYQYKGIAGLNIE